MLSLFALATLAVLSVGLPNEVANAAGFLVVFAILVTVQTPLTRAMLLVFSSFLIARNIAWRFASFPIHSALPSRIVVVALLAAAFCSVPFDARAHLRAADLLTPRGF